LAGYNAGQGNVSKAKRRNPGAGFFDLKLPRETQAYVPRLLALAAIVEDPAKYNITLPEVKPVETFATLDTHSQFQLDKLAAAIDLPMAQLYEWNPALNQWSTPPKGPHRIIVPTELDLANAQQAIDNVAPRARVDWKEVVVQSGDTLSAIARRHATDVTSLQLANGLSNSRIRAGKTLLIPQNAQALDKQSPHVNRSNTAATKYTVQAGDSLWSIARAHNVNLRKLIRHNEVGPRDTLRVGRTLTIPGEATGTRKVTRTVRYKVRKGDSLARIANKFNVSIKQIANWNNLDARHYIKPGQGLLLHVNVIGG
ncbi:MAG: LysM peptidoglycan-binding domain-containing protein, partial [Pseudomonadota bacterium]